MTKRLWLAPLFALVVLLAACSTSGVETAEETGTTEADPEATQENAQDTSTVTGDLMLVAPEGAASDGYDQNELTAPADGTFTIEFNNDDEGVPHNMQITDSAEAVVFEPTDGETITGVATTVYNVEGLAAGEYGYNCQVHPTTMNGTLTVA